MRITSMVGGAAVGLVAALAIVSAATAQDDTELPSATGASEYLTVEVVVTGDCTATITYTNDMPTEFTGSWAYWGDYRVGDEAGQPDSAFPDLPRDSNGDLVVEDYQDGHNHGVDPDTVITSGPLAGEAFGLQYNPVLIHRGETRTEDVVVTAPTTLAAWIKRGPEPPWYVGEVVVEVPCEQADDISPASPTPATPPADDDDAAGGTGGGDGESPAPGAGAELPTTGVPTWGLAAAGGVLLLAGTGAVLVGRRRRLSLD
ncbi:MAG UNVERIFIED_CONTAM: LPXTG cell wall anchor domain-containing protein [Thermobifida fusca]